MHFKKLTENQFNKKIKVVQCDGGGEFKGLQKISQESGFQLRMSCPYTSQQNGKAERKHRHVVELGLTLLAQAKMPLYFLWEAFSTAVFLINRLPTPIIRNKSPYSVLLNKEPDYNNLKSFGCACYPCIKPYNAHKLQYHTTKCVFLGYSSSHKGFKCMNSNGRIFISRHVIFNEHEFPFHDGFLNKQKSAEIFTEPASSFYPLIPAGISHNHGFETYRSISVDQSNNSTENDERRKARLVAKGFQQTAGVDFDETFTPVIKASTVRIILAIAVHYNWEVRQMDINNAFLNGYLKETVFMHQPEGFTDPNKPHHVCKFIKAIYGLKQAPRAWFDRLKKALLRWGFQNTRSDSSLFFLRGENHITFLLIYVDDIIVTGSNTNFLQAFIKQLNVVFALKDLGKLHYFLGIEVHRDSGGMFLKQIKYIADILKKFKMDRASSCPTPMVTGRSFTNEGEPMKNPTIFRQAIGALQYLTNSRPDIAYSVNKLCQYMSAPTDDHWQGIKRILRYLCGTINHCLHIKSSADLDIAGFSDAYWAISIDDRKSIAGQCVFLGESLIAWSSRKQKVVSRSSTESEYRALVDLAAEVKWIKSLLQEIKLPMPRKPILWCDNLSAKALASNPVMHARSKHIEVDIHFIRDQVLQNQISIAYVPSSDQIADCLTKALTHSRFSQLRDKLGVVQSPTRLRGVLKDNRFCYILISLDL
uniref:Copia protein n=1 Tax=Cajanus cajan TaxID=3821 RepID=A0A151U7U2_CAJCA|nr:Copia protein [Cajanus cajan]